MGPLPEYMLRVGNDLIDCQVYRQSTKISVRDQKEHKQRGLLVLSLQIE
jgi:hypothetical protein